MASTDEILVGANGDVYVGATTAVDPVDPTTIPVGYTKLGLIDENGFTMVDTKTMTLIKAWQLVYPARRIITDRDLTVQFNLRQWSGTAIKLAFGGGTIVGNKYTPPAPDNIDERSMFINWVDGTKHYRLFIPVGLVTNNVTTKVTRTAAADLPITFGVVGIQGADPWLLFTDDPSFAS